MKNSTNCVMADSGIGIENAGHVKMCNASIDVFKTKNNSPCRLDQHTLEEIWQSPTRQEISNDLKKGVRHSNCRLCWDAEDAGVQSIRQVLNNTFGELTPIPSQPQIVIMKPGNLCNLGCRTCNAEASNKLYEIDYKLNNPPGRVDNHYEWYKEKFKSDSKPSFDNYVKQFESQRLSFHSDNPVWKSLESWSEGIIHYALFGGEPFVIKPLFQLLENTANKNDAGNISLYVSTNATIWSEKYVDILLNYKSVDLGLSIDAIGDRFDYIRFPAKWNVVKENIKKYAQLRNENNKVKLKISATCNPFNIFYLDELYDFFYELAIPVDVHLIQIPEHYDIRIYPDRVKEAISKKFSTRQDLAHVIKFLNSKIKNPTEHLKNFIYYTRGTDSIRQQSFASVFPEFNEILKLNGVLI